MKSLLSKKSNSVQSSRSNSVSDYRPGYELEVTKKLSPLAYLIIGSAYTIAIVLTTVTVMRNTDTISSRKVARSNSNLKEEILAEIRNLDIGASQIKIDHKLNNHLEKFRNEMISEFNTMNIKYIDMITGTENKNQLIIDGLVNRRPSSINSGKGTVVKYDDASRKTLSYKHRQEFKRMKEGFKVIQMNMLTRMNLGNPDDVRKLEDFNAKRDIALYELRQRQYMVEKEFKKKQYIVINR